MLTPKAKGMASRSDVMDARRGAVRKKQAAAAEDRNE